MEVIKPLLLILNSFLCKEIYSFEFSIVLKIQILSPILISGFIQNEKEIPVEIHN